MEITDEFGKKVTTEQLESWDEEISSGDFKNWRTKGDIYYGPLKPANTKKEYITIQVPAALKIAVKTQADKNNCTQSELIRQYICDGLLN